MKLSERIAARLRALGYEVVEAPHRNMFYLNWGWRSNGTCCWAARIKALPETGLVYQDLLCQFSMKEAVSWVEWDIKPSRFGERVDYNQLWLDQKSPPKMI